MLRVVGSALILVGSVGLAWQAVGRLTARAEALRGLQGAVAYLEEELAFRFTPLPKLLRHLAKTRQEPVGGFFQLVLDNLEHTETATLRQGWGKAVQEGLPTLKEEERQAVEALGEILGQYDAQTQIRMLRLTGERLAGFYIEAQEERKRLGKVYLTLGVAGGLATVLILI